jgi:hypothetical protein
LGAVTAGAADPDMSIVAVSKKRGGCVAGSDVRVLKCRGWTERSILKSSVPSWSLRSRYNDFTLAEMHRREA